MHAWGLLAQIVILLAAALVAGGVMARLKQSPLVGYLLAGMVIGGPGSLGLVEGQHGIDVIAELGVSLLLFSLGLEFSWTRLRSFGTRTLLGGALQVAGTIVAAFAVGMLFGLGPAAALAVGAMVCLSSTAAVLRVLMDRGESDSLHGRNAVAVLLVQDVAVVPLAVLVTLLAGGGSLSDVALDVGRVLLFAICLVLLLYLVLNKLALFALGRLTLERNRELTILLAVVVGLAATFAAHAAGLSPAMGAFLAGMFLGGSPFATQVRADVASLRVVLLTLFFAAAGMVADPVWIAQHALLVLGVSLLVLVVKAGVAAGALRALGQPRGTALATGLCVAQIGEFAFVLGGSAVERGVVSSEVYTLVVSCTIVCLVVTPYIVAASPHVAAWTERRFGAVAALAARAGGHGSDPAPHPAAAPDVLVIGFGPAGQAVGRVLARRRHQAAVIDINPASRPVAERMGHLAHLGDAHLPEILEHAHVEHAAVVVVTIPSRAATLAVLAQVRFMNPRAHVIVRTRYQSHKQEFIDAGAHVVVDDEEEAGRRLAAATAAFLGRTALRTVSDTVRSG